MPFNPAVQDKTADYIFEGGQFNALQQERERVRQQQQIGQAMEQFQSLAQNFQQQARKDAAVDGQTEAFVSIAKQNPDLAGGMEFVEKILGEKNRDKRAGMLLLGMDQLNRNLASAEAEDRIRMNAAMRSELEREQAARNNTGEPFVVTDPVTGNRVGYVRTSPNSAAPIRQPVEPKPDPMASLTAAAEEQTRAALEADVTRLQGELGKGNKKPGPDFLPDGLFFGMQPFADQLKAKKAELERMKGAAVAAAPAGGAGDFDSPDAVREAFTAGRLSREEAGRILREQFGFTE